jgi:hypothetical protein
MKRFVHIIIISLILLAWCSHNATAQGVLTDGSTYIGAIAVTNQVDTWTFTATNGDSVVLRAGTLTSTNNFETWLRVYGPGGTLLGSTDPGSILAAEVTFRATNSGTFTVTVADGENYNYNYEGTGTYQLSYVKTPGTLMVSPGEEGGPLTNGTLNAGTITVGDIQAWSFTATNGDSVVLRAGMLSQTKGNFQPMLRVYGPDGMLQASNDPGTIAASEATFRATNSGTFTVLVADGINYNGDIGNAGTYQLSYIKAPGTLVVSPGEEGGPLTNGTLNAGTITVGDIQAWNFTATNGDSVVLRAGMLSQTKGNFQPWLRVYGPDGTLLGSVDPGSSAVAEVALRATNSGTFTVLVADGINYNGDIGNAGMYQLSYIKAPGAYVISVGEEGGSLGSGVNPEGQINIGDLNVYTFTICSGEFISLSLNRLVNNGGFDPWLRLYGPNGSLLGSAANTTSAQINVIATNSGAFTIVISDGSSTLSGTGTYQLISNGLSDGFKTCSPDITGANFNVAGVGGPVGTNAILFTTTNIANPTLWTPVWTNPFDQFGVFEYTNTFNPTEPKRFYRLSHP